MISSAGRYDHGPDGKIKLHRPDQDQTSLEGTFRVMVATKAVTGKSVNSKDTGAVSSAIERLPDEAEYRSISSLADAIELVEEYHGVAPVSAPEVLGDGFTRIDDKGKRALCGLPLFVMSWEFSQSETTLNDDGSPKEYVTCRLISERGGRVIKAVFSDGSTGIYRQLRSYTDREGRQAGLMVPNGLRASDFTYTDPHSGERSPATTYYFNLDKEQL